jgi:predicted hotdog family 3-hydroxylacyl-ACP dehydratase
MPVTDRARIAGLIPHAGTMILLENILEWDDDHIVCQTRSHLDPANPLRAGDALAAVNLAEYGAQAMAVHGGLLAERSGNTARPGMLASIRDLALKIQRLDRLASPLIIHAERLFGNDAGLLYLFKARAGDLEIGSGRIGIITLE